MLLVVNMDAPKNCSGCCLMGSPNCPYDGSKALGSDYPNCPIIGEIPGEHGRLIDADAFIEQERPKGISDDIWKESHLYKIFNNAPTILEASK